jgi:hypothetical protein
MEESAIFVHPEDYIAKKAGGNQKNFCHTKIRPAFVTGDTPRASRRARPRSRPEAVPSSAIAVPTGAHIALT